MSFIDWLLLYVLIGVIVSVLTYTDKKHTPDRAFLRFVVFIWPFYVVVTSVLGLKARLSAALTAFPDWFRFLFAAPAVEETAAPKPE